MLGHPRQPKPTPPFDLDPPPSMPPGLENFGSDVVSWVKGLGILSVIVGLAICGIMMALGRRNRSEMAAQGAIGIPWVIGAALIITGAAAIVRGLMWDE
ncbi:hypothetical protein ACFORH_38920 [Amycolatopsis roodepoortensis]|uniref:Type IV secretory pathway VirB2 component (Pilin) n=1 Tax=Amycolatopsis roodepoortensis TaxID=700274 RepID=A0ABR9LIW9_9PSEU|nr:hypothetical protein [Amycolatopsis roodepoortensis]MBE1580487.1 type IV secretory pathway VirB2 component (pilin) [Amycolatopsis roodepoortensis]